MQVGDKDDRFPTTAAFAKPTFPHQLCYNITMSKQVTLPIPEDIYNQVESVAATTDRAVVDVLLETISQAFAPFPVNPQRTAMKREIEAYKAMHPELVKNYLGQYVAVYQGKLIDHDPDLVALHQRITAKYPHKTILSRLVQNEAEPILRMRSPRLEHRL